MIPRPPEVAFSGRALDDLVQGVREMQQGINSSFRMPRLYFGGCLFVLFIMAAIVCGWIAAHLLVLAILIAGTVFIYALQIFVIICVLPWVVAYAIHQKQEWKRNNQ
jgi:hypothetical protein